MTTTPTAGMTKPIWETENTLEFQQPLAQDLTYRVFPSARLRRWLPQLVLVVALGSSITGLVTMMLDPVPQSVRFVWQNAPHSLTRSSNSITVPSRLRSPIPRYIRKRENGYFPKNRQLFRVVTEGEEPSSKVWITQLSQPTPPTGLKVGSVELGKNDGCSVRPSSDCGANKRL